MPNFSQHQSSEFTKLLLIGESGSGKTGSLASLAKAGYKLRILDLDNGLDSLASIMRQTMPEKMENIEFVSLRDEYTAGPTGPIVKGMPTAFQSAMRLLDNWDPGKLNPKQEGAALGPPAAWGKECILVIDSLTFLGDAAYNQAKALNPSAKDERQIYGAAQDGVENVLALIQGAAFRTNVIVISHIRYVDRPDGTTKGYASAIGGALSPKIPTYFNSVALAESTGSPPKRTIRTASTAMIDLKNPASFKMVASLPLDTGLADFFQTVRN
jgi:hypothetical protein